MSGTFSKYASLKKNRDISLFHGIAGDMLLLNEIAISSDKRLYSNIYDELLSYLQCKFSSCKSLNFNDGYAGVLYALAYLSNIGIIETDDDLYSSFDEYFSSYISALTKNKCYDLLYGLIGFGLYYIERSKMQPDKRFFVELIINQLLSIAVIDREYVYWTYSMEVHPKLKNEDWIYFGTLHGMPSVMSFLLICIKEGFGSTDIINVLKCSFRTIMKGLCKNRVHTFTESIFVDRSGFHQIDGFSSNLFYCSGDLGIINLLYEGSKILNDNSLFLVAKDSYMNLFKRIMNDDCKLSYNCFCHGWAGLLYFINKLSLLDTNVQDYTQKFIRVTVNRLIEFLQLNNVESGILTGYNGIYLSLLSIEKKTCLDRILLLS